MSTISFRIYRNTHTNKWTLSGITKDKRHDTEYPTRDDALQASYRMAMRYMQA